MTYLFKYILQGLHGVLVSAELQSFCEMICQKWFYHLCHAVTMCVCVCVCVCVWKRFLKATLKPRRTEPVAFKMGEALAGSCFTAFAFFMPLCSRATCSTAECRYPASPCCFRWSQPLTLSPKAPQKQWAGEGRGLCSPPPQVSYARNGSGTILTQNQREPR